MSSQFRSTSALFEQFARVGKALASPKRLELIDILAQGERSVESLARATALKLTTASAHLLVDVRPETEFAAAHIDGAISIPLEELESRLPELPEPEIVAYCRGEYCALAYDAVRLLRSRGRMARRLEGGMLEWHLEKRPIAVGS